MRRLILVVILLLGVVFLISNFAEFRNVLNTLRRGDSRFLLAAVLVQCAWFLNTSAAYTVIYRMLGSNVNRMRLLRLAITSDFINIIIPSLGMSGITMFASDARQRGDSPARAVIAGVIWTLCDYFSFLCVLAAGLTILAIRKDLHWSLLLASSFLLVAAFGLTFLLSLGLSSTSALGNALAGIAHFANRLVRPFRRSNWLSEESARAFALDATAGIQELRRSPHRLFIPFLIALVNKLLLLTILALSFRTFKIHFTIDLLVAGFSAGYLFLLASPTPSGIGTFEGALTLVLNSLNIQLAEAAVITLTYRAVTFWFPFLLGLAVVRHLGQPQPQLHPEQAPIPPSNAIDKI